MTPEQRAEIIRLLPCYRMGQLEPEAADLVRQALHQDPSLRELLATIQDAERLCAATLRQGAPQGLRTLGPAPEPPRRLDPVWAWLAAAAVVFALWVLVAGGSGALAAGELTPLEGLLNAARVGDETMLRRSDPGRLQQALLGAGVEEELARVDDLRSLGLGLEGALVHEGRVAVVWLDDTGGVVLCVTGPALDIHRTPDQVHRPDTGSGPVLQGHALGGWAAVYWERDGRGGALVATGDLDPLAAVAFQAVWSASG